MLIWATLCMAWRSLNAKQLRTLLTTLGIIVGVGSVIVMLAYGEGQKRELLKRFEGWGERMMNVRFRYWSWRGTPTVPRSLHLSLADVEAISSECSAVSQALAEARLQVKVRRGNVTPDEADVTAIEPGYFEISGDKFAEGQSFTYEENLGQERVCVLGSKVKEQLFYSAPAVDDYVIIDGKRFRVSGVLMPKSAGTQSFYDESVYIPWLTAAERMRLVSAPRDIVVEAASVDTVKLAERQIRELLHTRYPAIPKPADMYNEFDSPIAIRSTQSRKEDREQAADSFAILLRVIGGLSLLIGGVGVMNIMLVAVHERTAEIGLRKALGARRRDVLAQFLTEAVLICLVGGAIGMGVAFLACRWLARLPAEAQVPDPVITTPAVIVAVVVTLGTGLFFGVYPAARAARLDPITALHEGQ